MKWPPIHLRAGGEEFKQCRLTEEGFQGDMRIRRKQRDFEGEIITQAFFSLETLN